jgi:hypothetical protein
MKENSGVGMSRTCARCKAAFEGPNGRWMGVCNASCARNSRAHRQACHPPTARRSPLAALCRYISHQQHALQFEAG